MGCDIHVIVEKKENETYTVIDIDVFCYRSYSVFAFLANVRNYSKITPISEPRGIPKDSRFYNLYKDDWDLHSGSWLTINELLDFDYNQILEDRRCSKQIAKNMISGGETCDVGQGITMTYREYLGENFFKDLQTLKKLKADRILFCFDN